MKCGMEVDHTMFKIVCKLLSVCQRLKMATIYSSRLYPTDITYIKSAIKLVFFYTNKITQNITNYSTLTRTANIKARFEFCIEIFVYFLINSSLQYVQCCILN